MGRERVLPQSLSHLSRRHTPVVAIGCVAALAFMLGLPVVLIYLAVNVSAIRAFHTGFRDEFRFCRYLLMLATAVVFLLFPFEGFFTRGRT